MNLAVRIVEALFTITTIGKLVAIPQLKACAFIGMVAYFSGAFQVPITALVIVMEMTVDNTLVIPMMIAALVATLAAKIVMPKSLYHVLIERNYHHKAIEAEAEGGDAAAAVLTPQAAGTDADGASPSSQ